MERLSYFSDFPVVTGSDWPGVRYFCTTRLGGVSQGPWATLNLGQHVGDDPIHVSQNRQGLPVPPESVIWLRQVHGCDVYDVDITVKGSYTAPQSDSERTSKSEGAACDVSLEHIEADALVTSRSGPTLAIMTADCLPVVLASADGRAVGVAHAGWRGLASGVLDNTLAALCAKVGPAHDRQWRAWIGPGIGPLHFEVGNDVRHEFVRADAELASYFGRARTPGKWLADLPGIARHRLYQLGVSHVDVSRWCTYSRPDLFYSYRRDGVTGRMATFAWLDGSSVSRGNGVS